MHRCVCAILSLSLSPLPLPASPRHYRGPTHTPTHPHTHTPQCQNTHSFVRIKGPGAKAPPLFMGLWEPYTSIFKRTPTGFGMMFRCLFFL